MSITQRFSYTVKKLYRAVLAIIAFVAAPALRIFKPTEHTYPATGIQPYEGDPYKES